MTKTEFIFSNQPRFRIARHLVFWLVFAIHIFIFRFYVLDFKYLLDTRTYMARLEDVLLFLPASVLFAYLAIYFLLPAYILTGRYGRLFIVTVLVSILMLWLSYLITTLFDIRLAWDMPLRRATMLIRVDFTFNNGLVYPLTVSGFAIGIKMSKNFYLQQKENEKLARQKLSSQVQLMKNRFHPRFLFHALNNIYTDMVTGSRRSGDMLLKLSDLLSYILYESDTTMTLENELTLLKNYIELEQTGSGRKLNIDISDRTNPKGKYIEPLLLLPLAEFSFIHSTLNNEAQATLTINMETKDHLFLFTITRDGESSRTTYAEDPQLIQIKKRLQSQYPGKHEFLIKAGENQLVISLVLELN